MGAACGIIAARSGRRDKKHVSKAVALTTALNQKSTFRSAAILLHVSYLARHRLRSWPFATTKGQVELLQRMMHAVACVECVGLLPRGTHWCDLGRNSRHDFSIKRHTARALQQHHLKWTGTGDPPTHAKGMCATRIIPQQPAADRTGAPSNHDATGARRRVEPRGAPAAR